MTQESDIDDGFFCVIRYDLEFERIHSVNVRESLIGRSEHSTIWLFDQNVSREHALILWSGGRAVIRDLGSRNGTIVDGSQIQNDVMLADGSEIQIGRYQLKVCFRIDEAVRQSSHFDTSTRSDSPRAISDQKGILHRPLPELTPAQRRVYEGFIDGLSEKEIAARLKLSIHTVHTHAKAIYKGLAVSSRGELMKLWGAQQRNPSGS